MRIYCFGINLIFTSVIISAGMVQSPDVWCRPVEPHPTRTHPRSCTPAVAGILGEREIRDTCHKTRAGEAPGERERETTSLGCVRKW